MSPRSCPPPPRGDGAFHRTLAPALPQPVRAAGGTPGTLLCHPCTLWWKAVGRLSRSKRGWPGHSDVHWAGSNAAHGWEHDQQQCLLGVRREEKVVTGRGTSTRNVGRTLGTWGCKVPHCLGTNPGEQVAKPSPEAFTGQQQQRAGGMGATGYLCHLQCCPGYRPQQPVPQG